MTKIAAKAALPFALVYLIEKKKEQNNYFRQNSRALNGHKRKGMLSMP
jgi:hypothetical protein